MKKVLLLALTLSTSALFAQPDNDFKDLLSLFVDQKYEKVLNKAENYTMGDDTKKHPLPYLYIAMSLYEMSKIEKYTQMEEYKGAFKDAMKFCSKYGAKDKEKKYVDEFPDFFMNIRKDITVEGDMQYEQQKYTKAKLYYDCLIDVEPNDAGAHIMLGLCFAHAKAVKDSDMELSKAKELLVSQSYSTRNEEVKKLLKNALIVYANELGNASDKKKAAEWMGYANELFMDDPEWQIQYNTVTK
ncbi:MAG: hypothetical protein RLY35_2018 [Bacteroidota bacterium]|jgi:hypothetical protein